ncbi:family 20 glycosylhydrolase [Microbacterium sediminicola]
MTVDSREPLPLVPAPTVARHLGAPGFTLNGRVAVTGDEAAVETVRGFLAARTGLLLGTAAEGVGIELRIEPGGAPESYTLISDAGGVAVAGADAAGLFYGIHTLIQLVRRDRDKWLIPAVRIEDAPRFAYRGVMLDVARHFFPVETVCAYIDRAAALKFNHLHLHLSDDQGWRIDLPSRPELTRRAASSSVGGDPGGFYSAEDYARIIAHAAARHMTVVPEIDMPGHTHAAGIAYPDLVETPVLTDQMRADAAAFASPLPAEGVPYTGIVVGFSSLRIGDPATDDFVADVVTDLAAMTPGPYLHIGGDEALGTDAADYAAFLAQATRAVAAAGKTPIAWHEAGAAPSLHPGTIGQYWGFVSPTGDMDAKTRAFAERGGRVILSPADAVYLDMKDAEDCPLGLTWANGPTSLHRSYAWEPGSVIPGLPEEAILGVEAPLWTETIATAADIDRMAFPRIAAAAEAAWSAPHARDWDLFRVRLGGLTALWDAYGIGFHRSDDVDWRDDDA